MDVANVNVVENEGGGGPSVQLSPGAKVEVANVTVVENEGRGCQSV